MVDRITVTDLLQSGRVLQPPPNLKPVALQYRADFAAITSLQFQFGVAETQDIYGTTYAISIDNSLNPSSVVFRASITGDTFTCPANASGVFPIRTQSGSTIDVDTDGGVIGGARCNILFHNTPQRPIITYSEGIPISNSSVVPVDIHSINGLDPVSTGHGISDTTTIRVEIASDGTGKVGLNGLAAGAMSQDNPIIAQSYGVEFEACPVSATTVLGAAGAIGDYLACITITPESVNPGPVDIKDGAGGAIRVFDGGAGSVGSLVPFQLFIGGRSLLGAWQIVTGAAVRVLATGQFT